MLGQDTDIGLKMLPECYCPRAPVSPCPCCSGATFSSCCQPLLEGREIAYTAEQLMRSRYCAHATGQIQYIVDTWVLEQRLQLDIDAIKTWALSSEWLGLQILTSSNGSAGNDTGKVEFAASFKSEGRAQLHRETSQFVCRDGRWYFVNS